MTFEHSIDVRAPRPTVFALSQDYGRRREWDPFLRIARLVDPAVEASRGVRAYCEAYFGLGMETEYVAFDPPRAAAVRVTRGPWFLARFAGSWRFRELGPTRTRVTFRYRVEARPRWMTRWLTPVAIRIFERDTRARLAALREIAECDADGGERCSPRAERRGYRDGV